MLTTCSATAVTLDKNFAGNPPYLDTALPGTTSDARPELTGTVLADVTQIFSVPARNISGEVQSRVVREDGAGTLDFYWRVTVDRSSTGGNVDAFRLIDFGYDNIVDADSRTDGLGTTPASIGRVFNAANYPTGAINFLFAGNGVPPGDPASNANDRNSSFCIRPRLTTLRRRITTWQ